jgi:hypothetical protein
MQLDEQTFPSHSQEVQGGQARPVLQEAAGLPAELQDIEAVVDKHPRWAELLQDDPVGLLVHIGQGRRLSFGGAGGCEGPMGVGTKNPRPQIEGQAWEELGFFGIDLLFVIDHLEQVAVGANGLRGPQHEKTGRVKGVMENGHDPLLQR